MIKKIADYVNNSMKLLDKMNRVYKIDLELGGECKDLVVPHRRWIFDGELLRVKKSALLSKTISVRLYLFNDILVGAEKNCYKF